MNTSTSTQTAVQPKDNRQKPSPESPGMKFRRLFVRSGLCRLTEPLEFPFVRFSQLSRFANWVRTNPTRNFESRFDLYGFILDSLLSDDDSIDYLEFGVFKGTSIKWWVEHNKNAKSRFVGFDTFTGLPEKWNRKEVGSYSANGKIPQLQDDRCVFEAGLFQDTLPGYLRTNKRERRKVINLDADLYSSTLFVLSTIAHELAKGDIVIFDEFCSVAHEFRAFSDFFAAFQFPFEVIGQSKNYTHVAIQMV